MRALAEGWQGTGVTVTVPGDDLAPSVTIAKIVALSVDWSPNEFLRHGSGIADAWAKQGAKTRYEAVVNTNHFTMFDRLGDLWRHGEAATGAYS